jgi:hypothetical protein
VTGSTIRLTGGSTPRVVKVTGIGFVPAVPHNGDADGARLTPAGYDWIFAGTTAPGLGHGASLKGGYRSVTRANA